MREPGHNTQLVINELEKVDLLFPEGCTHEQLRSDLSSYIDHLVTNDFSKLISLLYRLDISETKLKQLLDQERESSAGEIIADLIIERQLQKIEARKSFKARTDIPEDEKW